MPVQLMSSTLMPLCTILASAWASQLVTHSSQPQGEEVRGKRAMFIAYLACLEDSASYVARGLLQILQPEEFTVLRCWRTKALYRPAIKREVRSNRLSRGPRLYRYGFGRPFQADTHVSLIDLVGDSCRRTATNQPAKPRWRSAHAAGLKVATQPPRSHSPQAQPAAAHRANSTTPAPAHADARRRASQFSRSVVH